MEGLHVYSPDVALDTADYKLVIALEFRPDPIGFRRVSLCGAYIIVNSVRYDSRGFGHKLYYL